MLLEVTQFGKGAFIMNQILTFPDINLADFEPVPDARNVVRYAISFSVRGMITLNEAFRKEIKNHAAGLCMGFDINKKDCRLLRLYTTDTPNYTFNSTFTKKDTQLTRRLVNGGISLPARYCVQWHEPTHSWIACFDGDIDTSALASTVTRSKSKRGNGHG